MFIELGTLFMVTGLDAKDMIRTALAEENVTTGADAVEYGVPAGVLVTDAKTADAQTEVIKKHSFDRYGRYTDMDRDDPNREAYLKGRPCETPSIWPSWGSEWPTWPSVSAR